MADAEPLITVIIPTFRRPKSLRRAIVSVLSQTFRALQVCVYDDASNDDTQKVVTELANSDSRVHYWCHEQNIGFAENFNYGLKEVDTPFFSFLCDDDVLLPHFFEQAMQALASNCDVMFYAGSTIMVEGNRVTHIAKEHGRFGLFPPPDGSLEILRTGGLLLTSIVFRSEVRDSVGTLDTEVRGPIDTDFQLRVAARHPVMISNEPSAIFMQHEGSLSTGMSDVRLVWPGYQIMTDKMMSDESLPSDARVMIRDMLGKWLYWNLCRIGERATLRGESDNVRAVAELMKRLYNKNTKAAIFLGVLRVREVSMPAYRLVSLIRRLLNDCWSFNNVLATRTESRQLQEEYGTYLHYLTDYQ